MPVALVGTGTAKLRTRLDHLAEESFIGGRSTRQHRSGSGAGIGTIEIEPDTARKTGRRFLDEACIGTGDAGLGAHEASLDTANQGIAGLIVHLRMGRHHRARMHRHRSSIAVFQ